MKSYRIDQEFSNKQIKGINMSVKALSSDYDFITGWEFSKNYNEFAPLILIDIIIDLDKVNEFYLDNGILTPETQIKKSSLDWWKEDYNQYSYFIFYSRDVDYEVIKSETKKIRNKLNHFYQQLPNTYAANYILEHEDKNMEYRCVLELNTFINKPNSDIYYSKV
jgi:hypothetical protein